MQQRARTQPAVVSGPSHLCLGKDPARALDDSSGPKALLQDGGTQIAPIFLTSTTICSHRAAASGVNLNTLNSLSENIPQLVEDRLDLAVVLVLLHRAGPVLHDVLDRGHDPRVARRLLDGGHDLRGTSRSPNGLKLEKETTHFIVRWTRVASMA